MPPRPRVPERPEAAGALARRAADQVDQERGDPAAFVGERLRRVALGLTAALVTARAYSASEPDLEKGAGAGLYWVLALLIAAGLGIAAGLIGGRFRFRWSWTDAAVVVLMVLVAVSATHALDRRPALNLAWEWIALAVAYILLRNLPRTRRESSALAGALVATALAVSAYGLYQASVEMPRLAKEYTEDPVKFLARNYPEITPGSHENYALEQRLLHSTEIMSTFALGNSLAVYLVGPLVLALAVGLRNLARRDEGSSRWAVLGMAAPLLLVMLVCMMLTKSRSAWIGLFVGLALVAWQSRRAVSARLLAATGLGAMVVVVVLATAGLAIGRLDRQVLTESRKSLGYRGEYWLGTWRVITGGATSLGAAVSAPTFWSGVGPGNFRGPYLRYKVPEASEEIQDPHNLFFEVWATGGFWALVALAAALALGLWSLFGHPSRSIATKEDGAVPPRAERARGRKSSRASAPAIQTDDEESDAPPCRRGWLVACAGAGLMAVVVLGQLNPFESDLFTRWLILAGSWLVAILLGRPLWRRLPIPSSAFGGAVAAVVVNLLAMGGIGFSAVALGLWSLLALGLNHRDDRSCSRLREYESRVPPFCLAVVWAAVAGAFLGAVIPYWRSEAAIAEAEDAWGRRLDLPRAELAFERAIAVDRYWARPLLGYADLEYDAWVGRGAKMSDSSWKKVPFLLHEAVILPRNPNSWSMHIRRADRIRSILLRIGSELAPIDLISWRGEIVKESRIAATLYPSNAALHARLAEASAEISMFGDAVKEAEEALRLDQNMPHLDRKLPEAVRKRLEARLPEWSGQIGRKVAMLRTDEV
jgi:hypothetical protein